MGSGTTVLNVNRNPEKIYPNSIEANKEYTRIYICPCSVIFEKCQYSRKLTQLSEYDSCKGCIFGSPMDFICHLLSKKDDYYHLIIM